MSQPNEAFRNVDRATYELGYLLRALPPHLHGTALTERQLLEVEAADLHALNSSSTLLSGIQSLGRVMWSASVNKGHEVDAEDFGRVGLLVTEVALQLQFLLEFRQSVAEHEMRMANTERDAATRAATLAVLREATDAEARAGGLRSMGSRASRNGGAE